MTTKLVIELFASQQKEYLKFTNINPSRLLGVKRPDLHAFLLLDKLCPGSRDLISCSEHDEIYLDTDVDTLAAKAESEDILDLIRCGINYDAENNSLTMLT